MGQGASSLSKQEIERHRDAMLLRLLKTPPRPRQKRERQPPLDKSGRQIDKIVKPIRWLDFEDRPLV